MSLKSSILNKLETLAERHQELGVLLGETDVIADQTRFRQLSIEYSQLESLASDFNEYQNLLEEKETAQTLLDDPEFKEMAEEELAELASREEVLETALQKGLIPPDPNDSSNVFLEIRAGTGGDEAAIFAGDLFRMYSRFADNSGWQTEIISQNEGEHGGFKEIVLRIQGLSVFAQLKFESGAHRVQRVPATESQGRIHTSAATVAVMPEIAEVEAQEINTADLRIDTFRASGAGGQHVNKTDSAIRLTHLPTGVVVECQDERSQHKNRARAMGLLQAKLYDIERQKQADEQAATRKSLVGSGDRSERIRTYNYPQGRVTDHRINLTLYKLDEVMAGDLAQVTEPLTQEHQADQLTALAEEH